MFSKIYLCRKIQPPQNFLSNFEEVDFYNFLLLVILRVLLDRRLIILRSIKRYRGRRAENKIRESSVVLLNMADLKFCILKRNSLASASSESTSGALPISSPR